MLFSNLEGYCSSCDKNDDSFLRKLVNEYSESLKKNKGIQNTAEGYFKAGLDKIYDGKVHRIALSYCIDKNIKYKEARECYYDLLDGLIKEKNKSEQLAECLYHFPISYEDLEVGLAFDYQNKGFLKKGDVKSIYLIEKEILYRIVKEDGCPDKSTREEIIPGLERVHNFGGETYVIRENLK